MLTHLDRHESRRRNRWPEPAYLPTPADIERECTAIQKQWSERERLRRLLFVVTDSGPLLPADERIPPEIISNGIDQTVIY